MLSFVLMCFLTIIISMTPVLAHAQWSRRHQPHQVRPWARPPLYPLPKIQAIPKAGEMTRNPSFYHGSSSPPRRKPFLEPHRGPIGNGIPRHPTQSSSDFLSSLFDPFGLFSNTEEPEPRKVLVRRVGEVTTTTEAPPPMVYFPDGGSGACEDFNPTGFNTYSFLSFLFSVANLVGLVANNVNNNLNNNNNNDNNNNNNLDNINVANSNSAQNNQNMVNIPAAMGRKRRDTEDTIMKEYERNLCLKEGEEVTALVAIDFIRGLKRAMLTSDVACALRNMCEINHQAVTRGELSEVIAEIFSVALVDMYPRTLPASRGSLLSAGSEGRKGKSCISNYPSCSDAKWQQITTDFDLEDLMLEIPPEELTKELGLPNVDALLSVTSFTSNVDFIPSGNTFKL